MTESATKLLESFERLDPQDQHWFVVSILRRAAELPNLPLTESELCSLTDQLFVELDAEENV